MFLVFKLVFIKAESTVLKNVLCSDLSKIIRQIQASNTCPVCLQTKPEVEHCRKTGQSLMKICGEPDKPEVKKHIEDLDSAWDNVTALFAKREENLIHAMEKVCWNATDVLS